LREQQLVEKQPHHQLTARRPGSSAWMLAAAGALSLAVCGGLAAWASRRHEADKKALEREIALQSEQVQAAQMAFDRKVRALEEEAHRYLGEAKTAKEQARILGDLQRQKQALEAARPRPTRRAALPTPPAAAPPPAVLRVPLKPQIDNEPLGGLPDSKSGGF
jgi:hypothetical protein